MTQVTQSSREKIGLVAVALLVTFAVVSGAFPGAGRAEAAPSFPDENAPDDQLLVVSNNVYDSEKADSQSHADMKRFATRTLDAVEFFPDVYLLQELRKSSQTAIIKKLNEIADSSQAHYVPAVSAPKSPWKQLSPTKLLGTDVSIVINDVTMSKVLGGHIRTTYKRSQSKQGSPVREKRHAYAFLKKRDSGDDVTVRASVASLHYPKWREFSSNRVSQNLKRTWTKQIADKLASLDASRPVSERADYRVIGGDANNYKCDMYEGCPTPSPMYDLITSPPYSYRDAVIVFNPNANPIDYLLTSGYVSDGGEDPNPQLRSDNNEHLFRWGLFEEVDQTGPTAPRDIQQATASDDPKVRIAGWQNARDGGTGVDGYKVWRMQVGVDADFVPIATLGLSDDNSYPDTSVQSGETYLYKVAAFDVAGNDGQFTSTVSCQVPSAGSQPCAPVP